MPYQMKDGRWRAVKMIDGQRKTKTCKTKSEAKKWEAEQDAAIWKQETSTVCLLDVATAYLDYSKARHHPATRWRNILPDRVRQSKRLCRWQNRQSL